MLDRYRRPSQARWAPILDTASLRREGRSERHWPVGVTTSHMACAILKVSYEAYLYWAYQLISDRGLKKSHGSPDRYCKK